MSTAPATENSKKYIGIKGWLLVLVIVLGIGMAVNVYGLQGNLSTLNDPDSQIAFELYPELRSVLYFEIGVILAAIVGAMAAIVMIFKRMKAAKTVVASLLVGIVVTGLIDGVWLRDILADNPAALEAVNNSKEVVRAVVGALVWVPYVYMSKRIKQTLIN